MLERFRRIAATVKLVRGTLAKAKTIDMSSVEAIRAAREELTAVVSSGKELGAQEEDLRDADVFRRKLHNTIEDLKGSIRVFCRVRPLSAKEKNAGDTKITNQVDSMTIGVEGGGQFQ